MKFLFDENVHHELLPLLKKQGHDVKLSPKTIKNGLVFSLSVKEERILLTRDSDFLKKQFLSSDHFGVFLIRVPAREVFSQEKSIENVLKQFPDAKSLRGKVIILISSTEFVDVSTKI